MKIFETVDEKSLYIGEKNGIDYFWAPSSEVVDGVPWRDQIPPADEYTIYTTFSSLSLSYRYERKNLHALKYFLPADTSSGALLFSEYVGQNQIMPLLVKANPTVRRGAGLMTGPLALGMYIAKDKPEILGNKIALIREYFYTDLSNEELQSDIVKLGYSYTKGTDATDLYLQALAQFAKEHADQQFFIIAKSMPSDWKKPANVHVVVEERMPLSRTKELISAANLPIMVTGDMSLTLAMEYEKEFFYEKLDHKFEIENELRFFDELSELPSLSIIARSEGLGSESAIIPSNLKPIEQDKIRAGFQWFFEHQNYMPLGLHAIRERISLPGRFLQILRQFNEPRKLWKLTTVASDSTLWNKALAAWRVSKKLENGFAVNNEYIGTRIWIIGELENLDINHSLVFSDDKIAAEYEEILRNKPAGRSDGEKNIWRC